MIYLYIVKSCGYKKIYRFIYKQIKEDKMFEYPNELYNIFEKLDNLNAKPIIVGGFVRDTILGIKSKDIDIEVYNVSSYEILFEILKEFGHPNIVGKSFGILKLSLNGLEIDFSLPRKDTKTSKGHKGFIVQIDKNLSFEDAAKRRDFTINAIGYDPLKNLFLDPFEGKKDLQNKILKAVDSKTFVQDPLRVLRGVVFCARFDLEMDEELKKLSSVMIEKNMLEELPKERIFQEIIKLLKRSKRPSVAFEILKNISQNRYFDIQKNEFEEFLKLVDEIVVIKPNKNILNKLTNIIIGILYNTTPLKSLKTVIKDITDPKPLLMGRDLIDIGLKPSKKFSLILQKLYQAQLEGRFNTKEDAKRYLISQNIHFSF